MADHLLKPWDRLDILHLVLYTVRGKQKVVLSSPFLLAVLLWSRQTRSKNKCHPFHWFTAASRLEPAVCQQSVCLSILPSTLYVCVLFVSVCFTVLFLCISPQQPGVSLWASVRGGFHGVQGFITNTLLSRMVGIQRAVSVCVWEGQVPSWQCKLPPSPNTKYKALIETSTAVAPVRVQLHSPCLMSSCHLQFGIKCAIIVRLLRAECKQPFLFKRDEQTSKRAQPKHLSGTHGVHLQYIGLEGAFEGRRAGLSED